MPTPTYDLISSSILSSNATAIEFTSIPSTYRDLILVVEPIGVVNNFEIFRVNGNTQSIYNSVYMSGNGSATFSGTFNSQNYIKSTDQFDPIRTSVGTLFIYQIMDYAATDKHKSILSRVNRASEGVAAGAHRWASTSAITSVSFANSGDNNLASGSRAHLYGIVS